MWESRRFVRNLIASKWRRNKSFELTDDSLLGMVGLIMSNTFLTDPASPGIDAVAIRRTWTEGRQLAFLTLPDGTKVGDMSIGSIGFIKGLDAMNRVPQLGIGQNRFFGVIRRSVHGFRSKSTTPA